MEGGFQGRTNKLVDGCYSFWQGGAAVLIQRLHAAINVGHNSMESNDGSTSSELSDDEESVEEQHSDVDQVNSTKTPVNLIQRQTEAVPLFQSHALQQYIHLCSQVEGGFRDKPGKSRNHYHTVEAHEFFANASAL